MAEREFFRFDTAAFNPVAGVKFALALLIAAAISAVAGLSLLVVFIGALLAWLTDVPGPTRRRISGMLVFGAVGTGLIWLAAAVVDSSVWFPFTLAVVSFLLTLPMAISQRAYMVGWSAILLFFSIAAFTGSEAAVQAELTVDLLIGVAVVVGITAISPDGIGPYGRSDADKQEAGGVADRQFVLVYAATVALVMGIALYIGMETFTTGAVWAANGAFFIIGPSTKQSVAHGIERAIAAVIGVILGVFAVEMITSDIGLAILWLVFGFAAIATLNAGYFVMVTTYTAGMTMTWAVQGQDVTVLNATERILAEGLALVIALAAVWFLQWWGKQRQVEQHVEAAIAS